MNTTENQCHPTPSDDSNATVRSHRVTAVAWLAGITAVCALGIMGDITTLGGGVAAAAACAMVAFVCHSILKYS